MDPKGDVVVGNGMVLGRMLVHGFDLHKIFKSYVSIPTQECAWIKRMYTEMSYSVVSNMKEQRRFRG